MLLQRVESEGLAHYSYLVADRGEAVVIDPRRDCDTYLERSSRYGLEITHVLETHRNEDYVVGSVELASRTSAEIWHADSQLNYKYGQAVDDGQVWKIGSLRLKAIHSPGHTLGGMSYLLYDSNRKPWVIFSGDTLFAGDVGRVDLLGMDQATEMASKMYDTLFEKILSLGDGIIVCPAHGAGSVCGTAIAERPWTTIGIERRTNPRLQHLNRAEFISEAAKEQERPPYFRRMEELNIEGPPLLSKVKIPRALAVDEFERIAGDATVLDTRSELGFSTAHVPNAISIWMEGLPSFAGWFLPYDRSILAVNETDDCRRATRYLARLGYDNCAGYLSGGMLAWHMAGKESSSIKAIVVQQFCRELDKNKGIWILDVRSEEELESGRISDAHHIHVTQLPHRMEEVPKDRAVNIFCGSGVRSMTAASLLKRAGWENIAVILGGIAGWNSITCPIK